MSSKKGVDTIIAVLLVVMITIAAAGSFYFWYMRVQQEAQGKTEQSTSTFLNQINTCIKMPYFAYNLLTNISESQVQNCGSTPIIIGDGDDNILISSKPCSFAVDSQVCDTCPFTISPGAIANFNMNFNRATCSGTTETAAAILADEGNIQHDISFSMDKATISTSKSFYPEQTLTCSVNLNGTGQISFPWLIPFPPGWMHEGTVVYNLSLYGNIPQTFLIGGSFDPVGCSITYTNDSYCRSYNYHLYDNMTEITNITVNPNTDTLFLGCIYCALGGHVGQQYNLTTTVASTDLATCAESKSTTTVIGTS